MADRRIRRSLGRVRGNTAEAKEEARARFLPPLYDISNKPVSATSRKSATPNRPHTPRGCPFQAWSLGELLRLERSVL